MYAKQGWIQEFWIGGVQFAKGFRFYQFDQLFLKYPMKMKLFGLKGVSTPPPPPPARNSSGSATAHHVKCTMKFSVLLEWYMYLKEGKSILVWSFLFTEVNRRRCKLGFSN